ncbi:MAG: CHRD domain-containing protein [Thermaurantiacus sp.]
MGAAPKLRHNMEGHMHRIAIAIGVATFLAAPAFAAKQFGATLTGAQEVPPVDTPASGSGLIVISGSMMNVSVTFANLTTPLSVGHIHCCAPIGQNAGVAVDFMNLPAVQTGSFDRSFNLLDAATYTASFFNASGGTAELARDRLLGAFNDGTAYFNLHTPQFPGGEIRGQIGVVPEPGTWAMLIAGFGLVGGALRRRRPIVHA